MKYNDSKNKIEKTTSQTSPAPEAKAPERVGFFRRIQLYISNQTSERRANTPKQGEPGYRIFVARRIVAISLPVLVIMLAISISVWSNIMFSNLGSADGVIEPDEYDLAYENMEPEEEIVEIAENDLLDVTSVQTTINEETLRLLRENQMKQVTNVLLIGVDRRGSKGNSRADTLMVASIDKLNNKLKLTSIMRDTLVPIEGHNQNKINAACAFGGVELQMKTVNESFGLNIDKYVMVDFRMFKKLVDEMGGVSIELTRSEVSAANDCIAGLNKQLGIVPKDQGFIKGKGGIKKLNGNQALGYVRIRNIGHGDYQRTERQQNFLKAVFSQFKGMTMFDQQELIYQLLPFVETNLSPADVLDIAFSALYMDVAGFEQLRLPIDGHFKSGRVKGMSVLIPDLNTNALLLHEFIYELDDIDSPTPTTEPLASAG